MFFGAPSWLTLAALFVLDLLSRRKPKPAA